MFNHKTFKYFAIGLLLLLSVGMLSACSGGQGGSNTVNATMTSYKIDLSSSTIKAGEVTFKVTNKATDIPHEFVILKTDLDAGKLPTNSAGLVEEDQFQNMGEVELDPGKSGDVNTTLEAGHYAIICNLPGHYAMGMYTNLTVQ